MPDGDPIDTTTLGSHDFAVTAADNAGNTTTVTHTYTVIDVTDPNVTIGTPNDGATFDQDEAVNADYSCADETNGSGLASCVGDVPDGDPIDTSTLGPHGFSVTATDKAGNTTTVTHSYTVEDVTDPTVTITAPTDAVSVVRTDAVAAECSCADEAGGSGVDTCVGDVADGDPIDTSTEGQQTFAVTATDNAGNATTVTHTYTVNPIPDHGFSDVPAWVDESVRWLTYHEYASGYPDDTFQPNWNITRAQVANMLWGIEGSPAPGAGCSGITDAPAWARDAVCWLVNEGHANGFDDHTFRPGNNITRAQTANMLYGIHT